MSAARITGMRDSASRENRMLKPRMRTLAVAGATIMATALVALGTTGASAAPMTASALAHATAPRAAQAAAADPSGCVEELFTIADEQYRLGCVIDAQVLFNDLYTYEQQHPNHEYRTYLGVPYLLTVDGSYGPITTSVVEFFQKNWPPLKIDGELGMNTWAKLCFEDWQHGYTGPYWHGAGCATEPGL